VGTERLRVATYRERLDGVRTVRELLDLGRELHTFERAGGHVAALAQLLAGAQAHPRLAPAAAAGLALWTDEIEKVLERVVGGTPLGGLVDVAGLAKAISAAFVGLQLYEGVDVAGADAAFGALEQLAALVAALDELGPVAGRAVRSHLRRTGVTPPPRG
jgi:hypothetical protein